MKKLLAALMVLFAVCFTPTVYANEDGAKTESCSFERVDSTDHQANYVDIDGAFAKKEYSLPDMVSVYNKKNESNFSRQALTGFSGQLLKPPLLRHRCVYLIYTSNIEYNLPPLDGYKTKIASKHRKKWVWFI